MVELRVVGSKLGISYIWMGGPLDRNVEKIRFLVHPDPAKSRRLRHFWMYPSSRDFELGMCQYSQLEWPQIGIKTSEEEALRKFLHQGVDGR